MFWFVLFRVTRFDRRGFLDKKQRSAKSHETRTVITQAVLTFAAKLPGDIKQPTLVLSDIPSAVAIEFLCGGVID